MIDASRSSTLGVASAFAIIIEGAAFGSRLAGCGVASDDGSGRGVCVRFGDGFGFSVGSGVGSGVTSIVGAGVGSGVGVGVSSIFSSFLVFSAIAFLSSAGANSGGFGGSILTFGSSGFAASAFASTVSF